MSANITETNETGAEKNGSNFVSSTIKSVDPIKEATRYHSFSKQIGKDVRCPDGSKAVKAGKVTAVIRESLGVLNDTYGEKSDFQMPGSRRENFSPQVVFADVINLINHSTELTAETDITYEAFFKKIATWVGEDKYLDLDFALAHARRCSMEKLLAEENDPEAAKERLRRIYSVSQIAGEVLDSLLCHQAA